jgi:hypothetical protein
MTLAIPQHSSATNEHYTPDEVLNPARELLGGAFDLDPASSHTGNSRVRANRFLSQDEDGLRAFWSNSGLEKADGCRVFLNPPGGKLRKVEPQTPSSRWHYQTIKDGPGESSAAVWWSKLVEEYLSGRVAEAIFVGFTLELLASTQGARRWPGRLPFCVPKKRLRFLQYEAGGFRKGNSPTHSNIIVYLPDMASALADTDRFRDLFGSLGECSMPGDISCYVMGRS